MLVEDQLEIVDEIKDIQALRKLQITPKTDVVLGAVLIYNPATIPTTAVKTSIPQTALASPKYLTITGQVFV